jgi:voltage-dependent anion channel protein 2
VFSSLGDNALNASFYHVVDPSTNTGVGVDLSHNLSAQVNEFTVGLQHSLDPFTTVKARITNSGKASALLQLVPVQYKWLPRSLLNISGEVDTKNIRNSARVGLSLVLH